jgi:hypothetical protein
VLSGKQLAIQNFGEQAINGIIYIETKEFVKNKKMQN